MFWLRNKKNIQIMHPYLAAKYIDLQDIMLIFNLSEQCIHNKIFMSVQKPLKAQSALRRQALSLKSHLTDWESWGPSNLGSKRTVIHTQFLSL